MENQKFKNFISLGYFCEVAKDLELLGLHNTSSPFDWVISDFEKNIILINNKFNNFMLKNNLEQSINDRNHYCDVKYNFYFFHDFSQFKSLDKQYDIVHEKYERRINRFFENITKPTLFVRYISDELKNSTGKAKELRYIEDNYDYIINTLKKYNSQNEIIFIANNEVTSSKVKIYNVTKDYNDIVSRHPIINSHELLNLFSKFQVPNQKNNIKRAQQKYKKRIK